MSTALPVSFVYFAFSDLYHDRNECYTQKLTTEWFEEGVKECAASSLSGDAHPLLTLEQWPERGTPIEETDQEDPLVLVQILHMMPLKINNEENPKAVLHELVMVAWSCRPHGSMFSLLKNNYRLKRRPETKLYVILDTWSGFSAVHCFKESHLALMFTKDMFARLLDLSAQLDASLQDEIDFLGSQVMLGRRPDESDFHNTEFHKARTLVRRVYELADLAWVSVRDQIFNTLLMNIGLYLTGNLGMVRAVQARPEEAHDDNCL